MYTRTVSDARATTVPDQTRSRRFDAIICDIDGCLCPEDSGPMDAAALTTIAEHNRLAQSLGDRPVLTLCSGRPQPFVEAICRLIGNATLPCVAENGVWIYHPASNRYEMDPRITPDHLDLVNEAWRWIDGRFGSEGVVAQPGKAAAISLFHADTAFLRSIVPKIQAHFKGRAWPMRVSMTWLYINCDLSFVSKASALDRLMEQTGLTRDRCAGIGDTPADLAIADRVARFACPANAHEQIRQRADLVATRPEAAGVVEIIGQIESAG